jgi:hypothetical protein
MYALVCETDDLSDPKVEVLSVHRNRNTAEAALEKRKKVLGKKVWECNSKVVWIEGKVKAGSRVSPKDFATWRPGEKIPHGELYSDTD